MHRGFPPRPSLQDPFSLYVSFTAAWLALQGTILVGLPKIVVTLLLDDSSTGKGPRAADGEP